MAARRVTPAALAGGPGPVRGADRGDGLCAAGGVAHDDRVEAAAGPPESDLEQPVSTGEAPSDSLCRHAARPPWVRVPPTIMYRTGVHASVSRE
ncbi:hypothetical protein GCM10009540_74850 [Streptomyces turgidiscabies]